MQYFKEIIQKKFNIIISKTQITHSKFYVVNLINKIVQIFKLYFCLGPQLRIALIYDRILHFD